MSKKSKLDLWDDDPGPGEAPDEVVFADMQAIGWKPEDLVDKEVAAKYKEWLAKNPE